MPVGPADGDGDVVAHDLGGGHGDGLALRGVDLSRHDGGARLVLRQGQLPEAAAGTGGQESEVVGDLHERACDDVERAGHLHHGVVGGEGLELVGGGHEGEARQGGHLGGHLLREANAGVEAGANRSAAGCKKVQPADKKGNGVEYREIQLA